MNKFARTLLVFSAAAGLGYFAYSRLLTDEAKDGLRTMGRSVKDSYERMRDVAAAITGQMMDDDGPLPNAEAVAQQWRDLGY